MEQNQSSEQLYIPHSDAKYMPSVVKNELKQKGAQKQEEFLEEYRRKKKSLGIAYIFWFILGLHYAYMSKWGLQILMWITGWGLGIWWVVDAFRLPGIIENWNKDAAMETFRAFK